MRIVIIVLAVLLVGLTGLSAWILLQSCAVRLPFTDRFLTVCDSEEILQTRADLAEITRANQALSVRVGYLEHKLGGVICKADPPPPPPPPPPPKPKNPGGLDQNAFDDRDISVMQGCWKLSSDLSVRDVGTGRIAKFDRWRICFDRNGNGTQVMRSTSGVRCEGRMTGTMPGNGRLNMSEAGNLRCDNNSYIYRRKITCTMGGNGAANCKVYQPETNSRSTATLRRARR